ncbi:bifunctional oligoribonuclease/PAP phosphatase NrnA [Candidatus Dependentiae bacterium]|nr:bifunctional oligoribonuclease/PAP phosphatase NrnA [Candidatus Dependentiae bacterium]
MNKQSEMQTDKAWAQIKKSSKITLLTHFKPDGDGIAACIAFELVLSRLGKQVETIYPSAPELELQRRPQNVFVNDHSQSPDLLIALDTANYERLYYPQAFRDIPLINIDHHVSNSINGAYNFIDPNASSVCEVLFNFIVSCDREYIDREVAENLLFGILYDSRVFHTQSTYPTTLRIAADLVDLGGDLFKLKLELLAHKSPKIFKLWALMLDRLTVSVSERAAWSYLLQDDLRQLGLSISSLVGFNDFLADISGIDVTILFYETEDGYTKVSLRSKEYDVNVFAAKFGGGGHKHASGIRSNKPLKALMAEMAAEL